MVTIKVPDASEVTFTYSVEPDDTDPRGNFMATEDPVADKREEDAIIRRLDAGDVSAWCGLVVLAEWRGFVGRASVWGCSYDSEEDVLHCEYRDQLTEEALGALQRSVQGALERIQDRLECSEEI